MKELTKERIKNLEDFPTLIIRGVLMIMAIIPMIISYKNGNTKGGWYCILFLLLSFVPLLLSFIGKFHIPRGLEILVLLYIFTAEVLGETFNFYIEFPIFDSILHYISGIMFTSFGIGLISIFMKDKNYIFVLKPILVLIFAIGITLTIGVLWEFFEYTGDKLFGFDMQRDRVVNSFNSVNLDESRTNSAVKVEDIQDVIIVHSDGEESLGLGGYLDLGVWDTMKDLALAFVSSVIHSVFAYIYLKSKGKRLKIFKYFIPYPN